MIAIFVHMRLIVAAVAVMGIPVVTPACAAGSASEINGNWYCNKGDSISYTNFGRSGTYNEVTNMAPTGSCSSKVKAYGGSMAPLNEEVGFALG